MRRVVVLAMFVALTLGVIAPGMARAQSGTPTSQTPGSFGIPVGTAVPIYGSDGSQIGTITVSNITDSFTGYDSSSAPQRGYRYALAEVTVANTGATPMEVYPNYLLGVDSEGFISEQPYVTYTDTTLTPLEYTEALAPGASVTGVIPYQLFGDTTLQRMVYAPTFDRQIAVLDLRTAPVVAGTPVSVLDNSGLEKAQVTVNGITDPFTGYDSFSAPPRGTRYILVDVTVTNTGAGVLSTSPSDFWVVDSEGFVLTSAFATRTDTTLPDFTYLDLNPGESQQGALLYAIFEGIPPAQISWGDAYSTLNVVADLSAGMGAAQPASQPPAPTAAAGFPTAAASGTEVATTAAVASTAECAGLPEWGLDLLDRITRAGELVEPLRVVDPSTLTAAQVTELATQLRAMGDEQAASNPPPAADDLNTIMVEQFYYALADALDEVAIAIGEGNMIGAMTAMQDLQALNTIFADGGAYDAEAAELTAACPAEIEQMNAAANS